MSEILINRTNPLAQLKELQQRVGKKPEAGQGQFSDMLADALKDVNELQNVSNQQISKIMEGDISNVHTAMIAMEKAGISFQLAMQVRNKLMEAYQEVMRMQV